VPAKGFFGRSACPRRSRDRARLRAIPDQPDATIDPKSDGGKKLDAALAKQAGELAKGRGFAGSLQPDEIGIYGH
jgi:hypothetical protein